MALVLESASAADLAALPRESTVFFFPVGVVEDHGPSLPMTLDLDEAEALSLRLSDRVERDMSGWRTVLMPRLPVGVSGVTTRFSFTSRPHVLRDCLVDVCEGLARQGFRRFVCVSGTITPRQLTAIEEAGELLARRMLPVWKRLFRFLFSDRNGPQLVSLSSGLIDKSVAKRSPFWPEPSEHGGAIDASIALASSRDLAEKALSLPRQDPPAKGWALLKLRLSRNVEGYWGDPSAASRERGAEELKKKIDDLYPKLRASFESHRPRQLFRSWYSYLPPNGSFFRAWIMALLLALLLSLWVSWNVSVLVGG